MTQAAIAARRLPRVRFMRPRWPRGSKWWLFWVTWALLTLGLDTVRFLMGEDVAVHALAFVMIVVGMRGIFAAQAMDIRLALACIATTLAISFASLLGVGPVLHGVPALVFDVAFFMQTWWFYLASRDRGGPGETT